MRVGFQPVGHQLIHYSETFANFRWDSVSSLALLAYDHSA